MGYAESLDGGRMNSSDLTVEQRVQKGTLAILMHQKYRSLAGILMMGNTTVEDDAKECPTAYTDGLNTKYGRAFCQTLSDAELRFLILHENLHKALLHLITWMWMWKEDAELANRACDYVINLMLVLSDAGENFIKMPAQGAFDMAYEGMDAGEVYRLLQKNKKDGKGGDSPQGFDQHDWEKAKGRPAKAVEEVTKQVEQALQQGSILAGKLAGGLDRAVREVLAPKVDWVEEMRDFVTTLCSGKEISTWRRPNRRLLDSGIYLPSHISETVGRVGIGNDTSMSIDNKILSRFLSESAAMAQLVKPEVVDLLYWDTRVAGHEKYSEGQYEMLAESTKPKGGGGTRPSCVTEYLAANKIKLECFIMLTDGEVGGDWGGVWPCPVLWCITNKRITAGNGRTLYIGD
jgi:predicted metal-dependent peptidase